MVLTEANVYKVLLLLFWKSWRASKKNRGKRENDCYLPMAILFVVVVVPFLLFTTSIN
jgi:hypothetical protein